MKHSKVALVFSCLLTVIFALSGCGKQAKQTEQTNNLIDEQQGVETVEYVALELGGYDAADGGHHTSDYSLWSKEKVAVHLDETAPATATITFNGQTYTGNYQHTYTNVPDLYESHRYRGNKVYFTINAETGECCAVRFAKEPAEEATLSYEECRAITDAIASEYIDLSEYETEVIITEIRSNYYYYCRYYREVSGFPTWDYMLVTVDGNGNIVTFGLGMIDSFADAELVEFDQTGVTKAIEDKLNLIYKDKTNRKGYEIENVILTRLEDGSVAFLYRIHNSFIDVIEGEEFHTGSEVKLFVKVQENR